MSCHRRSGLILALASLLLIAGGADDKPPRALRASDFGKTVVVIGNLGRPIGKRLTIHGRRKDMDTPTISDAFVVDEIDGEKLPRTIRVSVPRIHDWPDGAEATLRGYERGDISFISEYDNRRVGDPPAPPRQVLFLHFAAEEIVGDSKLKLGEIKR